MAPTFQKVTAKSMAAVQSNYPISIITSFQIIFKMIWSKVIIMSLIGVFCLRKVTHLSDHNILYLTSQAILFVNSIGFGPSLLFCLCKYVSSYLVLSRNTCIKSRISNDKRRSFSILKKRYYLKQQQVYFCSKSLFYSLLQLKHL